MGKHEDVEVVVEEREKTLAEPSRVGAIAGRKQGETIRLRIDHGVAQDQEPLPGVEERHFPRGRSFQRDHFDLVFDLGSPFQEGDLAQSPFLRRRGGGEHRAMVVPGKGMGRPAMIGIGDHGADPWARKFLQLRGPGGGRIDGKPAPSEACGRGKKVGFHRGIIAMPEGEGGGEPVKLGGGGHCQRARSVGILAAMVILRNLMITFSYQARDTSGKIVSGLHDALNEDNAISALMGRGLMVLSLQKKAAAGKTRKKNVSVKETDLVLFTRQLSTMVEAGISLVQAMTALYEQCDPKRQRNLRQVVSEVTTAIQSGETMTEAISKHPRVFSRLYCSMIKAGEQGGLLAEILDRLAGFLEASARLRKKVKSAMTYPVIVICIAFAITTFLIVKVVPIFGEIFKDFGAKLPAPTQFLIDMSEFIRGQWYFLAFALFGAIFGIRYFLRTKAGRQFGDKWKLKLPVFGPLVHKICMSRFARTFAQLIRSGVPILEVLDIVGATSGNHVVESSVKVVSSDVEKGDNLSVALSKQPVFPPMMLRMVAAGEATGKIDTMLEKMADFWDEEIEAMLDALTSLIEPMLIVFLGVIVGGIVIAMFLPIFKLNEVVSQSKN